MEFKKLELEKDSNWFKRIFKSPHSRRTAIYIALGAVGGFIYFYFTQGQNMDVISARDVFRSMGIGGFFGFFITNSPCARGRC